MAIFNTSNRYYLNGIDWVMAALNILNKKYTGLGNHSQLILILDGYLDKKNLAEKLKRTLSKSTFLKGKTKRAWHLAPYWVPEKHDFNIKELRFFKIESADSKELDIQIKKCAKTPFKDSETLLGFDLIHFNKQSYLIMRFDHKMFDARGAEALLEYILDDQNSGSQPVLPIQSAQLHSWKTRFLSGQHINRFLRSIYSKKIKVASLNTKKDSINLHNFYYSSFSEEQTEIIDKNAVKEAGYLMNGIYLLGCAAKCFNFLFKKLKTSGDILIPINVDIRETKFNNDKIFFNNVSFMLFNLKSNLPMAEYINTLKAQFIDQIKRKIPYHFTNAALLMRIMPLTLLSFFMRYRMNRNPTSFSFSYIAEQAFNLKFVHGLEVINLFHMPIVPFNPGVGVFFTRFNNKLNMIVSTFDSKLNFDNGKLLHNNIITEIVNEKI